MSAALRPEDLVVQSFQHPSGEVSVRLLHLPSGARCVGQGRAGQSLEDVVAELTPALEARIRELQNPRP